MTQHPPRRPLVLESAAGPEVEVDGKRVIYVGGTNYFGMSTHPEVVEALREGARTWGLSPGAGRTTSGTSAAHLALERGLRHVLGTDAAVISASGYQANAVIAQAFAKDFDVALMDSSAHASIRDAVLTSGLTPAFFAHADPDDLEASARKLRDAGKRVLVGTDGVFPTSGELAPAAEYRRIARELDLGLLIDDAHGIGVLGKRGGGLPEHAGIKARDLLYTGSLSKAFGVFGGFAGGPAALARRVEDSPAYEGATPLPPALAAAASRAIDLVCRDGALRRRLRENTTRIKAGLKALGLEFPETPMPIARFVVGDAGSGAALHGTLRAGGVLIPFNTYPGGPAGGYFRLVVTAAHTPEHIERVLEILSRHL